MPELQWAAIFDFDGVIADTIYHHEECWREVAIERGTTLTRQQFLDGNGTRNYNFVVEILKWTSDPKEVEKIVQRKEALFWDMVKKVPINPVAGVEDFLKLLKKNNVPCALGSSSIRKNIDILFETLPLEKYFSAIVTGEDVEFGKPNPEVFVKAALKLGILPKKCIVFEDATLGIEAGTKAGAKTIALTTTFSKDVFEKSSFPPNKIIHSFDEISFCELENWFS